MSKEMHKLRRQIMRRIYYAYAIGVVASPVTIHGMAFAVALAIFAQQVHFASIIHNMMSTQLGQLPSFAFNAIARGEVVTLFALGVLIFIGLSMPWRLVRLPLGRVMMTP